MKYAIILPDGAADFPLPQLDGKTPLEAARIPHMDSIAAAGQLGCAVTIPAGFTPGTDVGTLSLLGYDPHRYYSGRAPIEAAAKGLAARPDQMIFRCNLVTIEDGRMKDFTAGHIKQPEADRIMADLNAALGADGCEFHPSVSYRNLLLLSDAAAMELRCQPPHDIPDQPVEGYWPRGKGAERVMDLMQRAARLLADHPVTRARRADGRNAADQHLALGPGPADGARQLRLALRRPRRADHGGRHPPRPGGRNGDGPGPRPGRHRLHRHRLRRQGGRGGARARRPRPGRRARRGRGRSRSPGRRRGEGQGARADRRGDRRAAARRRCARTARTGFSSRPTTRRRSARRPTTGRRRPSASRGPGSGRTAGRATPRRKRDERGSSSTRGTG